MVPGDLVINHSQIDPLYPCRELGEWGSTRFEVPPGSIGILLEIEDYWATNWLRILFPQGVGWISNDKLISRCENGR